MVDPDTMTDAQLRAWAIERVIAAGIGGDPSWIIHCARDLAEWVVNGSPPDLRPRAKVPA